MHQTKRWHIAGLILADVCAQGPIFNQYFISVLFCELLEMLKTDHAKHKNLKQYIGNVWLFFTTLLSGVISDLTGGVNYYFLI